jgi:hypothetical protein
MKLLTNELRAQLPPLYATDGQADPIVICKFFAPWLNWTWFAIEFDGEDTFFGLFEGGEIELGYFSLADLESVRGLAGLAIERDLHFKPRPLSIIRQQVERR